jgi:hypothetical protein
MAGTALGPRVRGLSVGPGTGFGASVGLSSGLGVSIALSSGLGVSIALSSGLGVSIALSCGLGVSIALSCGLGVSIALSSGRGVSLGSGVDDALAVADSSWLGDCLGVDLTVGVATGCGTCAWPASGLGGGPRVAHQVSEDIFHRGGSLVRDC